MHNQPMGLARVVLRSAKLDDADLTGAGLSRVDLEFASLRGVKLSDVDLTQAPLGGTEGAMVAGANFIEVDLDSTSLAGVRDLEKAIGLDKARNLDRVIPK